MHQGGVIVNAKNTTYNNREFILSFINAESNIYILQVTFALADKLQLLKRLRCLCITCNKKDLKETRVESKNLTRSSCISGGSEGGEGSQD